MPGKMARSAPDHRSGCPMRWWPSSPRGCLAGKPEIREYSRQIELSGESPVKMVSHGVTRRHKLGGLNDNDDTKAVGCERLFRALCRFLCCGAGAGNGTRARHDRKR